MQDVASAAGVTKAALYYHFADKGESHLRMLEDLVEDILVEERKVAAGPGSFEQRLTALAKQASDMWETDLFRLMQDAHQHLGEARHSEVHAAMDRLSEPVQVLFDAEYGSTGIDPRLAAALFQTTIAALIMSTRSATRVRSTRGSPTATPVPGWRSACSSTASRARPRPWRAERAFAPGAVPAAPLLLTSRVSALATHAVAHGWVT